MSTIIFNGKTYNSVDEMPANERQAFEHISNIFVDRNGNGIPDYLEGDMVKNVMTTFTSAVNVDGKTYSNMEELPPDVRAKVQGAFEKLSEMGIVAKIPPTAQDGMQPMADSKPFISREYNPTIQEERSNPMMWVMIGALVTLCLVAAAAGVFLLAR